MFFASDNWAGAHSAIAESLVAEAGGFAAAYGSSDLDKRVADRLMMMLPGGAISPKEIGEAIVYLANARMATGTVLAVDGGMS